MSKPTEPINSPEKGPMVILVVGVNGVGKTTTIGKLAANFIAQNILVSKFFIFNCIRIFLWISIVNSINFCCLKNYFCIDFCSS